MKTFKITAVAAALAGMALSASAGSRVMKDEDLAEVSGKDGVSIVANLNLNIGAFQYTDTDTNGGSVSFNNIGIKGILPLTIDIISSDTFGSEMQSAYTAAGLSTASAASLVLATSSAMGLGSSDVVKFAIPNIADVSAAQVAPTISIGSITMGNGGGKSFGSMALNKLDMRGTAIYMWAH